MNSSFSAIILAGGRGTRFGAQKQFLKLRGKELYLHVRDKASNCIGNGRVVVVGVDVPPGETRSYSVMHGLDALPEDTDRVIILEAARPLVTEDQINVLLEDAEPSSSFVMPLINTVIGRDGSYMDRSSLYELLTPQAFDFHLLREAYRSGKFTDMTDETRVIFEAFGIRPHLIETGDNLLKVTYPRDIAVLNGVLEDRPWLL